MMHKTTKNSNNVFDVQLATEYMYNQVASMRMSYEQSEHVLHIHVRVLHCQELN